MVFYERSYGWRQLNWEGTPLYLLFAKHIKNGEDMDSAIENAGKDSGWLLKRVIHSDKRLFETKREELIRKYRWIKN